MCYVIELIDKYIKSDYLAITIEKKEGIKMDYVIWRMMSDHNYLQVITDWMFDFMPFKFISKFGDSMIDKITTVQSVRYPLKCKMYTPDYISEQQCLVNEFLDKDFSPCPVKCVPIQMRGFRYVISNSSSDIKNCDNLEDEICNGGPTVWKKLRKHFEKCMKPCRIWHYDQCLLEKMENSYIIDNENEASFALINSDISPVEKEVLLYDLSDLLGAVGGSLGVGVGISVFTVISCCIDNFLKLLNMFQRRKSKNTLFVKERSQIPIYIGRTNAKSSVIDNPC